MNRRSSTQITLFRRFDVALTVDIDATEDLFTVYFVDYIDASGRCLNLSFKVSDAATIVEGLVGQDEGAVAATVAQLIGLSG